MQGGQTAHRHAAAWPATRDLRQANTAHRIKTSTAPGSFPDPGAVLLLAQLQPIRK